MAVLTADVPAGWEGILEPGERILWQGRPDTKVAFTFLHAFTFAFGAVFSGLSLAWMIGASGLGGAVWMFGLIHFSVGVAIMLGPILWPPYARRHTWYTLTDHRAFIATDIPVRGRQLKSYEIGPKTPIDHRAGPPDSIYFAHIYRRTKHGRRRVDIGFERIGDSAEVMQLIGDLQRAGA